MKKVGIIGGLSPESTVKYYQDINAGVRKRLGGHHGALILLSSVDFAAFVELKEKDDWDTQGKMLADEAAALERAGADFIVLATNTLHKVADRIEAAISIPFLHLVDATADRIVQAGLTRVGLLGTIYTMEQDFYKERLRAHGIETVVPDKAGRKDISGIIYDELTQGIVREESREIYRLEMKRLAENGAQGIVFGCTEIPLLVGQADSPVPVFDTTAIHVEEILERICPQ